MGEAFLDAKRLTDSETQAFRSGELVVLFERWAGGNLCSVYEAAAIAATKAYGVPQSQGLAFAVVLHALNLFPFIAAGLVLLAMLRRPGTLGPADDSAYGASGSQSGRAR
jgi:hypothetical protein